MSHQSANRNHHPTRGISGWACDGGGRRTPWSPDPTAAKPLRRVRPKRRRMPDSLPDFAARLPPVPCADCVCLCPCPISSGMLCRQPSLPALGLPDLMSLSPRESGSLSRSSRSLLTFSSMRCRLSTARSALEGKSVFVSSLMTLSLIASQSSQRKRWALMVES